VAEGVENPVVGGGRTAPEADATSHLDAPADHHDGGDEQDQRKHGSTPRQDRGMG